MDTKNRGARPTGTDGSDFAFRQRLDPRYEVRASLRGQLRLVMFGFWLYLALNAANSLGQRMSLSPPLTKQNHAGLPFDEFSLPQSSDLGMLIFHTVSIFALSMLICMLRVGTVPSRVLSLVSALIGLGNALSYVWQKYKHIQIAPSDPNVMFPLAIPCILATVGVLAFMLNNRFAATFNMKRAQ